MAHRATTRKPREGRQSIEKVGRNLARVAYVASPFGQVESLIGAMANPESGIKFVLGIAKRAGQKVSEVQSVLFDRVKWTVDAAKDWLQEHGFSTSGKDEGATFWRFRQSEPGKYKEFRTVVPGAQRNPTQTVTGPHGTMVRIWEQNGSFRSTFWVNGGETITSLAANHSTLAGAKRWADRVIQEHVGRGGYANPLTDRHPIGSRVSFRDNHKQVETSGEVLEHRRALTGPWKILVVRTDDGRQVEVHPDRVLNPTPGEAIESYDEHLKTTTDPEFQTASPEEQAAAMTAQDLAENPACPDCGKPQEIKSFKWPGDSRILGTQAHCPECGWRGPQVPTEVKPHGLEEKMQNPSPAVTEIQRQLIAQGFSRTGLQWVAMDANTLKVSLGTNGAIIRYDPGSDLYYVTEYHGFDKLPTLEGIGVEQLYEVVKPMLYPKRFSDIEQNPIPASASIRVITRDGHITSFGDYTPEHFRESQAWAKKIHKNTGQPVMWRIYAYFPGGEILREAVYGRAGLENPSQFDSQHPDLGQAAFDAGKNFRLTGAYNETGVANARVVGYGFSKWYNSHTKDQLKGHRKLKLSASWRQGWNAGKRIEKKQANPESAAADLYKEFHGQAPGETLAIVTERKEHEWLTQLGTLVELKVETLTKLDATLRFSKKSPELCSSEDGRQLYIEGGDQALDLKALKMDSDKWVKDSMTIGVLYELTYRTAKGFHKFKTTDYFHKLGEETGVQPFLLYDPRNKLLSVSGGQYQTKPEGIVN